MRFSSPRHAVRGRGGVLVGFVLALILVMTVGSSVPPITSARAPPSAGSTLPVAPVHPGLDRQPLPIPPVHVRPIESPTPDTVNPTGYYSSEPAPMGIGDFGVGAGGSAYTYNSTEFLGNFSWQTLNLQESGNTEFTDQLNVVLQFVQNGITYAYWIQDVAFMDSSTNELTFENNIWNFTSSCLNNTAVSGNGTVWPYSGCQGYYAVGATIQPGADLVMPTPGDFGLLVRSYKTVGGLPEVAFEYWDGVTSYYVTYDNVVFPWASGLSSDNNFVVDGFQYNPLGLYYDAELTIGGPGGGATTQAQNPTHTTSRLLYWNGHNFEAPPSVWNFGSNTGEAVGNIQSIFSEDRAGLPLTLQLNGTARNATPAQAYDQNRVGELAISAPGITDGTVAIPGDVWSFVGGSATLTLTPGGYRIWVNSTSSTYDLGICAVQAGTTTNVSTSTSCGPSVSTPTASVGGVDLGQSVTFQSTLLSPGAGGDTYVWNTSPAGLGCSPSTSLTLSCTPTSTGVYSVNVTVTDSTDVAYTSPTLRYTVSTDPTVGRPSPSRTSVETGESVSFTASPSGGASPYSYQWVGLPAPCTHTTSSSPTCTPSTAGSYSIGVTVTDANNFAVTSADLAFTVLQGPSVAVPTSSPVGSIDLGQSVTFSTSATGGSGAYTFTWSGLPRGCASASLASLACTPTAVGVSAISVRVVDSNGGTASSGTLDFTVHSELSVGALEVTPSSVDVGQTLHFALNGTPTGGAGSYRYLWSGLPPGCVTNDSPTLSCIPSASGTGTAELTVHDADNGVNSTTAPFEVSADPSLVGLLASPSGPDVGQSVTFSLDGFAGGTTPYTYRWSGLPAGCTPTDAAQISCNPSAVGTSEVSVNITDANGLSVEGTLLVTVLSDPTLGTPTATPGSGQVGHSVTFSVVASGGSGGYTYTWIGLPTGCASLNASAVTCQSLVEGTYLITVHLTDSNGYPLTSGALDFSVTAAPSTFLGLPALEGYALVAGVAALVVVGVMVVVVTRSRRGRGPPSA